MILVNKFNLRYSLGKWEESLETIDDILSFNRTQAKTRNLYWPLIVKGTCELQLDLLKNAEKTFTASAKHEKAEENAHGGLGHIYFRQNELEKALQAYFAAFSKCPEGAKAEVIYNIVLTAAEILNDDSPETTDGMRYQAKMIINNNYYLHELESLKYINLKEEIRTKYLIGLALFKGSNYYNAYDYFKAVYEKEAFSLNPVYFFNELGTGIVSETLHTEFKKQGFLVPVGTTINNRTVSNKGQQNWVITDGESIYELKLQSGTIPVYYRELSLIINFSLLLESLNNNIKALDILLSEAQLLDNRVLFRYYADLLARTGQVKKAAEVYENHLCCHPYDKQFLVEHAIILMLGLKDMAKMRQQCELALAQKIIGDDKRSHYYHGFALYLLGQRSKSLTFYELSDAYAGHYEELIK